MADVVIGLLGLVLTMQGFALLRIDRLRDMVAGHAERITALETYRRVEHPNKEVRDHG